MELSCIVNRKEIWLPLMLRYLAIKRVLEIDDLLCPEGLILPSRECNINYRDYKDNPSFLPQLEDVKLMILTPDGYITTYRTMSNGPGPVLVELTKLNERYMVYSPIPATIDLEITVTYMFQMGLLKTPREFLRKARKTLCLDASMLKYNLSDVWKRRQELYGDVVPLRHVNEFDVKPKTEGN